MYAGQSNVGLGARADGRPGPRGIVLLLVGLLGLLPGLGVEVPLLEHEGVLGVLLAEDVEGLVELGHEVGLPAPVVLDPTAQPIDHRLPLRRQHLAHARCLAHLLLLLLLLQLLLLLLLGLSLQLLLLEVLEVLLLLVVHQSVEVLMHRRLLLPLLQSG